MSSRNVCLPLSGVLVCIKINKTQAVHRGMDEGIRNEKGTGLASRAFSFSLRTRTGRRLRFLECRARGRGSGTTRVVTDNARLVGEERALAALANHARYRRRCIGDVQSAGSWYAHGREFITALH